MFHMTELDTKDSRVPDGQVNSLARGLAILEVFGREGYGLSLADVALAMNLPKSTTHRLLSTLTGLGYLDQPRRGGRYYLAPPILGLGYAMLKSLKVREAALPHLAALFENLGENVNLSVLGRDEIIYVVRFEKRAVLALNLQVGSRLPIYNSSPGRVLAAFLPDEEREAMIQRLNRDPECAAWLVAHGEDLRRLLDETRARGWAYNDGDYLGELFALAAPVLGENGQVLAAVNVPILKAGRRAEELIGRVKEPALACAARISAVMGYRPPA